MNNSENVKNYYNEVADEYNDVFYIKENEYPPLKYRHNYILKMIADENLSPDAKILDIGCGPGELVLDLSKNFNCIFGIDISEEMIKIGSNKLKAQNIQEKSIIFDTGDIEHLVFEDNYFDVIICSGVVEYLKTDNLWIKEVSRILKSEGILIVNVTNKFAVRRWTMPIFSVIKLIPGFYSFMNFTKTKLLGMEKLNKFPFKPRTHSPNEFDEFLKINGFSKISHNYFDFSIFPYPIDTFLNFIFLKIRKRMEKNSASNSWLTGNGYIVKCKKLNNVWFCHDNRK